MIVPPVDAFEATIARPARPRQPVASRLSTLSQPDFEAAIMAAWWVFTPSCRCVVLDNHAWAHLGIEGEP
jgi:hypothetical protein